MMRQKAASKERVEECKSKVIECLDGIEKNWLQDKHFLMGDQISVADIFAACEIEQISKYYYNYFFKT